LFLNSSVIFAQSSATLGASTSRGEATEVTIHFLLAPKYKAFVVLNSEETIEEQLAIIML